MMTEKKMQQPLEFEGKTVDDAIKEASEHFSVTEKRLDIEIITKGATGIFGLGGRKAKIKATLKDKDLHVKEDKETLPDDIITEAEPEEKAPVDESPKDPGKSLERALDFTQGILKIADLNAQVHASIKEDRIFLDISGDDVPLIIGKDGHTLNSLEYIVNRMLFKQVDGACPVKIDADSYKARKEEGIARLAQRKAEKALKAGRSMVLDPMNSSERRVVHITLKRMKGIKTLSIGEGHVRRVVIKPLRTKRPLQRGRKKRSSIQPTE